MKPDSNADRRQFLRDLDELIHDLTQPFGEAERTRPRARDVVQHGLRWRLCAEPESPIYPRMFRLTWGVNPASRPATNECMWAEDVQQLLGRSRRGIYTYRLGPKPPLRERLTLSAVLGSPYLTLATPDMTDYLRGLLADTVLPLFTDRGTPEALSEWVRQNPGHVGRGGDAPGDAVARLTAAILAG